MESRDWSSDVCSSDLFPSHDRIKTGNIAIGETNSLLIEQTICFANRNITGLDSIVYELLISCPFEEYFRNAAPFSPSSPNSFTSSVADPPDLSTSCLANSPAAALAFLNSSVPSLCSPLSLAISDKFSLYRCLKSFRALA